MALPRSAVLPSPAQMRAHERQHARGCGHLSHERTPSCLRPGPPATQSPLSPVWASVTRWRCQSPWRNPARRPQARSRRPSTRRRQPAHPPDRLRYYEGPPAELPLRIGGDLLPGTAEGVMIGDVGERQAGFDRTHFQAKQLDLRHAITRHVGLTEPVGSPGCLGAGVYWYTPIVFGVEATSDHFLGTSRRFKLAPGDLMIFDNHRHLHGRSDSTSGRRRVQGNCAEDALHFIFRRVVRDRQSLSAYLGDTSPDTK